jgi:hypothetical protein
MTKEESKQIEEMILLSIVLRNVIDKWNEYRERTKNDNKNKPKKVEDKDRIKAMLSFDEKEIVSRKKRFEYVKYLNRKGEEMVAFILLKRKNGEIVVENLNGVRICLSKDKIIR